MHVNEFYTKYESIFLTETKIDSHFNLVKNVIGRYVETVQENFQHLNLNGILSGKKLLAVMKLKKLSVVGMMQIAQFRS